MEENLIRFQEFLKEEIDRVRGGYYPVKAGFLRRILVRHAWTGKLHPNPEDEFCLPEIGPSYRIIGTYQRQYADKRDMLEKPDYESGGSVREAIIVQKAMPDGYLILNGHHRWAAAFRAGVSRVKIKIVNLTQEKDVRKMLEDSRSDRRVAIDLDEVVFCAEGDGAAEKPLRFPLNRIYPERIRKGIPALFHYCNERNIDIWVYTSKYCSMEYIQYLFRHRNVRLAGIVTGTARRIPKKPDAVRELKKMLEAKYRSTVYIDRDLVIRTFSDSRKSEEYPLSGSPETWVGEILDIFRKTAQQDSGK